MVIILTFSYNFKNAKIAGYKSPEYPREKPKSVEIPKKPASHEKSSPYERPHNASPYDSYYGGKKPEAREPKKPENKGLA